MDLMGIDAVTAHLILAEELDGYKQTRFRLTTRLKILNRVEADPQIRQALTQELEKLEQIIHEYEVEMNGNLARTH